MKKKFKYNYNLKSINTTGSLYHLKSLFKIKLIEFNLDFISHHTWKKNINYLSKQKEIFNFNLKYSSYK